MWGLHPNNPRPQEFYSVGTAPLGFKIPWSATDRQSITTVVWPYKFTAYVCVCCEQCCNFLSFCLCFVGLVFLIVFGFLFCMRASLHHAVSLHCACAVPVWSELPDLHLLPVASSGPRRGAPADGSQELGNRVHLPDQAGQIQKTEEMAGKTSEKSKLLPNHHSNTFFSGFPFMVSSDEDPQV